MGKYEFSLLSILNNEVKILFSDHPRSKLDQLKVPQDLKWVFKYSFMLLF